MIFHPTLTGSHTPTLQFLVNRKEVKISLAEERIIFFIFLHFHY